MSSQRHYHHLQLAQFWLAACPSSEPSQTGSAAHGGSCQEEPRLWPSGCQKPTRAKATHQERTLTVVLHWWILNFGHYGCETYIFCCPIVSYIFDSKEFSAKGEHYTFCFFIKLCKCLLCNLFHCLILQHQACWVTCLLEKHSPSVLTKAHASMLFEPVKKSWISNCWYT